MNSMICKIVVVVVLSLIGVQSFSEAVGQDNNPNRRERRERAAARQRENRNQNRQRAQRRARQIRRDFGRQVLAARLLNINGLNARFSAFSVNGRTASQFVVDDAGNVFRVSANGFVQRIGSLAGTDQSLSFSPLASAITLGDDEARVLLRGNGLAVIDSIAGRTFDFLLSRDLLRSLDRGFRNRR